MIGKWRRKRGGILGQSIQDEYLYPILLSVHTKSKNKDSVFDDDREKLQELVAECKAKLENISEDLVPIPSKGSELKHYMVAEGFTTGALSPGYSKDQYMTAYAEMDMFVLVIECPFGNQDTQAYLSGIKAYASAGYG